MLEKQWAYHVECESSPHEWMLGGAASKLRAARRALAEYVRADVRDVVLVENCTAATTAVIRAAGLRAGDVAIHLSTAYGMVKNCVAHAAESVGAEVRCVPVEFRGRGTPPLGAGGVPLELALADAIDDAVARGCRVALVTFDYIASCPGAIMPALELARACKARGVPVLCDGAHILGQIPVDCSALEEAGVTYLMADAHKWLFSPKGSAMLWVTRGAQSDVHPSVIGAVCSNSPLTSFDPAALEGLTEFERRFQYTGTRDYTPLIAVHDALKFRARVGEETILAHNRGAATWAQEWLAKAWRTETLTPPECVANMAHARVPVSSMAAATLLNRTLKEDRGVHVMGFSLPPREHLRETEPTHWVRPCAQLFVSRDDFRALGAAVLELAPGCEAAAKCGAAWLAKTRARSSRRRAMEAAKFVSKLDVGHKVTVGFAPPARSDSAFDLTARAANAVAAVAKYSAGGLGGVDRYPTHPRVASASALPALAEDGELVGEKISREGVCGVGSMGHSPTTVMDAAGSVASSAGTSVDGSGFIVPEWSRVVAASGF